MEPYQLDAIIKALSGVQDLLCEIRDLQVEQLQLLRRREEHGVQADNMVTSLGPFFQGVVQGIMGGGVPNLGDVAGVGATPQAPNDAPPQPNLDPNQFCRCGCRVVVHTIETDPVRCMTCDHCLGFDPVP